MNCEKFPIFQFLFLFPTLFLLNCAGIQELQVWNAENAQSYQIIQTTNNSDLEKLVGKKIRNAYQIKLDQPNQIAENSEKWGGVEDLSGAFALVWSDRQLFFQAKVMDDEILSAEPAGSWGGDAVNLFLKTENEEGVREFIFKFSPSGWRYCYYDRLSYNGEEYQWGELYSTITEDGYTIDTIIPFRNLGLLNPLETQIWINISIEDQDGGKYMILSGDSDGLINAPEWVSAKFTPAD